MSEIKPVSWFTEDHLTDKSATTYDIYVVERWINKGWPVTAMVLYSDHEAEVASLRAEVEKVRGYEVAPLEAKLAESDAENAKMQAVANAARQVAAWLTSGNNVPVSGIHQITVSNHSIMADVHVLNEALAAMGASA
ncbi:hypothetical protein [Stenotrophomonas sp. DR009]|uniref:hypothetical protein n=1 Tax=Stenotrophomonas sp. DR009 TaxID=3398461 RepID=UPI003BAF1C22